MIRFGISEKAVEDARKNEQEAAIANREASEKFSELVFAPATRRTVEKSGILDELHAKESAWRESAEIATAMNAARNNQIENEIRRALCDAADELNGKPTHYKRTAKLIQEIVARRLEISPDEVTAYNNEYHFNFKVIVDGATVEIYVHDNEFEADAIRNWCRSYDDGRDDLTPAKVRRLVAQRSKEERRLKEAAEAHKERARAAIDKFACIGDTKQLKDAAKVQYI